MKLVKALRRDPFPQQLFSTFVSDDINDDAAQRRTRRCHEDVKQKPFAILVDVAGDDHIHR